MKKIYRQLVSFRREFISELRARSKSRHWFSLFLCYVMLLVRKALRVGFSSIPEAGREESIDLVVLTVSKDHLLLETMIESVRTNILHPLNKIYIVSRPEKLIVEFCEKRHFVFVDEVKLLGYGKDHISYTAKGLDRSGWMFQQLLKLSGDKCVEMKRYLIVDSDTVFIQPHSFIREGRIVFLQNSEWHQAYFDAFEYIFGYEPPTRLSFTSHMMLFDVNHLAAMKREIETRHGKRWDEVYVSTVRPDDISCISDYETYANWVAYNHPDQIRTDPLYNIALSRDHLDDLPSMKKQYQRSCKSISFHAWMNESRHNA